METPILQIYNALKPIIFNSQVVFYNLLFNFSKHPDNHFFSELTLNINILLSSHNHSQFVKSPISKEFYKKLFNDTNDIDATYPSIKSNQINSDTLRTDINTAMHKNNEKAIPKYWRETYLTDSNRPLYKETLHIVLIYYILMYHYDKVELNSSTNINNLILLPKYLEVLTHKLGTLIHQNEALTSIEQLSNIIINQLYKQCEQKPISSLQNQMDFYMSHIECYGDRSIDKFYALKRYFTKNAYCAYALANIYYYGSTFYAGQKEHAIEIQKDFYKAAYYYTFCTQKPNLIVAACWSLGYMYQTGRITSKTDNLKEAIRLFKKCGNYPPALSNLGLIEKSAGDKILFSKKTFSSLSVCEQKACIKHYLLFIKQNYAACCNDWVYAFNNLYDFYYQPKYLEIRNALQKEETFIHLNPMHMLQQAADMKNYWAMDTLAIHYICDFLWKNNICPKDCTNKETLFELVKQGSISLSNIPKELRKKASSQLRNAESMLKELNNINYARGTFHLAINFYYDTPILGNLLKKAADQGYEQAKIKFNEVMQL
ncbi:MAG: sel1 repeat family protein [Lachnospiraceae bacterium]|nr:sel1 repeat family protein [Lachnospiraceae bacterium]